MMSSLQSEFPEITILDKSNFDSLAAFQTAVTNSSAPKLLVIDPVDFMIVSDWIQSTDDICFSHDENSVVSFRANRLRERLELNRDPLTHVLHRQNFERHLIQAAENASPQQPQSLLLCDLDYFKAINDKHGHAVGDEVLKQVARTLQSVCDRSAKIGRIGGEEFAVLCNRDENSAKLLADEIRHQISLQTTPEGVAVTASIGVVTTTVKTTSTDLMGHANQAVYSAKARGRNQVFCFSDLIENSKSQGQDVDVLGLENQAKVLAERVANVITMRSRQVIQNVRKQADVDALTGVFSRRYLDRKLEQDFQSREEKPLSVAFLDLDHFGKVNKKHGWPTGDKLLVEVCQTIETYLRKSDWVGRYGGEEFCVVMPATDLNDAINVLQRIREEVESSIFKSVRGLVVPMTLSVGAALALHSDSHSSELIERASQQALFAKRGGRNRICVGR